MKKRITILFTKIAGVFGLTCFWVLGEVEKPDCLK